MIKKYENWYFMYYTKRPWMLLLISTLSEFKQGLDMQKDNKNIQN